MYYYNAILPLGTASRGCSHSTLTNGLSLKPGHRRCPDRLLTSLRTPSYGRSGLPCPWVSLRTMGPCRAPPRPADAQWHGHFSTERHGTQTQGTEGALDHQPRAPKVPWTATHEAARPSASSSLAIEFLSSFVGSIPLRTDLTRPRSRDLLRKVHVCKSRMTHWDKPHTE